MTRNHGHTYVLQGRCEAQNMHQAKNGAFTGEISAAMLNDVGVKSVILGHSERRTYFGEDDQILTDKVASALENNLEIIFLKMLLCV